MAVPGGICGKIPEMLSCILLPLSVLATDLTFVAEPELVTSNVYSKVYDSQDTCPDFAFVGQLISRDDESFCLWVNNQCVSLSTPPPEVIGHPNLGDIIKVLLTRRPATIPPVRVIRAEVLGHRPLPEPTAISYETLRDRQPYLTFVRMRGVVFSVMRDELDARWNWIQLKTTTGPVAASCRERQMPYEKLKSFVDAECDIEGYVMPFVGWRTPLGKRLDMAGPELITVTQPAPAPLDAIPLFHTVNSRHRQRTGGTVLAVGQDRLFIACPDGKTMQVKTATDASVPAPGDRVTVAGFADLDPIRPQLIEAIVRIDKKASGLPKSGEPVRLEELFLSPDGQEKLMMRHNHRILRIRGKVRDIIRSDDGSGRFVLQDANRTVQVDASGIRGFVQKDLDGCTVDVTGLCVADFENQTTAIRFPRFRHFSLLPRTMSDLAVVSRPPWWTPFRLLALIVFLLVVIVAILIWNRALRTLSERRGKELYREELAHALAEWKVEERTRLSVELHDSLSQTLTGVALQVDAAKGSGVDGKSPAAKFLETARTMLASCRQELRCCIWDLKSRTFEEKDMTEAVKRTLAPHVGEIDLQVRFNVPREILSETSAHDILRIVRELAVNAIRHGRATQIRIAGECRDGTIRFSVRDNGCGFDPAAVPGPRQGHFGLQGIRERIGGHNGDVRIESAEGAGTKVSVSFDSEGL